MAAVNRSSLALIVQKAPYQNRVARADIDFALAAAALDFELQVYFQGNAALQLVAARDVSGALLPTGYRAWAALPDLAHVRIFVEQRWLDFCLNRKLQLVTPVESLGEEEMKRYWRNCTHVVVL